MKNWYEKYINEEEIKKVSDAVASVENRTTGEIVPMVVKRSSVLGQTALVIFACLLFIDFALFFVFHTFLPRSIVSVIFLSLIIVSFPLCHLFSGFETLQRFLTPKIDRHFQVMNRAQLEFYQNFANKTHDQTAVLIFVSLFEKECVVLADKTISEKLNQKDWDDVVKIVIDGIKSKTMSKGLVDGIQKAGEHLIKHFPASIHNANELPNELVIK